ncbi:MAG: hypothetical protein JKX73_04030, partial [Flavobacteriales bacterium]|nr:hypothetical protein [Flavobacteriales bacterium]
MSRRNRILITLALISAIGFSCRKDGTGPSWDVDLLAAIFKANLSLNDIITDSLLTAGTDGALSIVYNGVAFSLNLDTLVNFPDTSVQETFGMPISIKLGPGEAIPTLGSGSQETKYDLNDVELKQIKIRSGSLTFELQNSVDEVVDLTYTMPVAI